VHSPPARNFDNRKTLPHKSETYYVTTNADRLWHLTQWILQPNTNFVWLSSDKLWHISPMIINWIWEVKFGLHKTRNLGNIHINSRHSVLEFGTDMGLTKDSANHSGVHRNITAISNNQPQYHLQKYWVINCIHHNDVYSLFQRVMKSLHMNMLKLTTSQNS